MNCSKGISIPTAIIMIIITGFIVFAAYIVLMPTLTPKTTPFSIQVFPTYMQDTVVGQKCVFLVTVEDKEHDGGEVSISATAPDSTITVNPLTIVPDQVVEVIVIPNKAIGANLTVTIHGERDGLKQTETSTLYVSEELSPIDEISSYAAEVRDRFIPWLAENHPELGITSETEWTGTIVRPHITVVMFYLFFSDEWETGVSWHVMIPPHDWARIYLRHRSTEVRPSYAFEISSLDAQKEPHVIDLKEAFAESVWR